LSTGNNSNGAVDHAHEPAIAASVGTVDDQDAVKEIAKGVEIVSKRTMVRMLRRRSPRARTRRRKW
jgi:hypothetical protein